MLVVGLISARYYKNKHSVHVELSCYLIEGERRIYGSVISPSLVQIMACRLVGAKPFSETMMEYCHLDP